MIETLAIPAAVLSLAVSVGVWVLVYRRARRDSVVVAVHRARKWYYGDPIPFPPPCPPCSARQGSCATCDRVLLPNETVYLLSANWSSVECAACWEKRL